MRRTPVLAIILASAASAQTSLLPPDVLFLSRTIRHLGDALKSVPNYTCTETFDREELRPPARKFARLDLARVEVAKIGGKEVFGWPGAGKFEDRPLAEMLGESGLVADGLFNSFANDLFVHRNADMKYRGQAEFRGRKAIRIDYVVGALRASFSLNVPEGRAEVGYSGSVWVEPETMDLIRLEVNADDIPPQLRLAKVSIGIDFANDNALPLSAVVEMAKDSGETSRDQVQFANCRKFSGDATITFNPDESAAVTGTSSKITTVVLNGNLPLYVRLQTPVDIGTSGVGDEITGILENDVKDENQVKIPKGSIVRGRIRRLEKRTDNPDYVFAGLELSTIEAGNTRYEFVARLAATPGSPAQMLRHETAPEQRNVTVDGKLNVQTTVIEALDPPMAGVGYLYLNTAPFVLPAGFRMLWRTEELRRAPSATK